jgi:fluoroacetyl-CoA thioesterase
MEIRPGATAEVALTVTSDRTADVLGNRGVTVLATPFLVGLLEQAAGALIHPHLPPGASTVGTMVEMKHLAPTPVGMTVRARATLLETDGRRYLFAVEAWDEKEKVAEGRHERFVIPSLAKFLERAMQKAGAPAPPPRPGPAPREAR